VFVVLGHDGAVRIERGLIRPEDEAPQPETEPEEDAEGGSAEGPDLDSPEEEAEDEAAPFSERLVLELTAYRTVGLRDALAGDANLALTALVHALALKTFYPPYDQPTCIDLKLVSAYLDGHAPGVSDCPAGRRIAERHEAWASRLPRESEAAWGFVAALPPSELLDLLAHCVSLGVSALRNPLDRKPGAWAHVEVLAQSVGLDMACTWTGTAESYFSRVTKAQIVQAVREGAGEEAARRLDGLKKADMATAAEQVLAGRRWLPSLLRTAPAETSTEAADEAPMIAAE
jgi:ParB family chromosome partitioning protein